MALLNRFSRLFTADLHAVLDRIEEPDVLLKQAVREMEDELAKMQARSKFLLQDLEKLDVQQRTDEELLATLDEELDVCFESDEDGLARSLIRRKLEAERRAKTAAVKREATQKAYDTIEASVGENQRHLASMRQKLDILVDEGQAVPATEGQTYDISVGEDEIEIAYLKEKQRRALT